MINPSRLIALNPPAGSASGYVGGNIPVQGFGQVSCRRTQAALFPYYTCWYFRARGFHWSLDVGSEAPRGSEYVSPGDACWSATGKWGDKYQAGWMSSATAKLLVDAALQHYMLGSAPWVAPDNLYMTAGSYDGG